MVKLVKEYGAYVENLTDYIKDSKYKMQHFLDELNMSKRTFYRKLKSNSFSIKEIELITKLLFEKEAYKEELLQKIEEGREEIMQGNVVSSEKARIIMRNKLAPYQ
ncbi:MAG: hypothetical protein ABJN84_13660 [Flavobacteriaceae bacterium]